MSESKANPNIDWTKAQIKAAIEDTGVSMAALGRANGYDVSQTFYTVLRLPYPKVQKIVAEHLGVSPEIIWPSRYKKAVKITPSVHRRVA
ncbi:MAG: helix-turn-helix domain-containing protein [Oleispira sp.]|nr:helix-turn-helix domain-containing protein [Oleispira sp.]